MTTPDSHRLGRILTFYSYKGGTGRTMALANVAWILASNGHRVLAIDWDLESPGLHKYFHPFLVDKQLRDSPGVIDMIRAYAAAAMRPADADELDIDELAQIQRYASSLEYPFPDGGLLDLVSAGRQVPAYSRTVSTFNWDNFYERLGGGAFLAALREDLRRHYDYVLIDSRTGLSDAAGICTVLLPDVVVDCFTMSTQSIDGAVAVARSIRSQRTDPVQVFPVPMRIEDGEAGKLERSRNYARQRFEPVVRVLGLADTDKYWGSVEIPYKIFYAYEETLAAFGERARQEGTLLAAYERLTSALVGGSYELQPISEQLRQRWLADFERRTPTAAISLVVSYAAPDRMWAEWIAAELESVGQPSALLEVGSPIEAIDRADRMLVLLSEDYLRARDAGRVLRHGREHETPLPGNFLVPIRLDGSQPPAVIRPDDVVDLNSSSVSQARSALWNVLELPEPVAISDQAADAPSTWPRFPAIPPPVWKVPPRSTVFTGRDRIMRQLRDRLVARRNAVPSTLLGLGGVGKTQIALEYAHRFAADYDIVWWISADQPGLVRAQLASLATALRLASSETTDQVNEVHEALRRGDPSPRWLIIFDGSDDPEQIRPFIPEGPGDVIVTSRSPAWQQVGDCEDVGVFERQESLDLLARRVATLAPRDADQVAERLGDLPLAIDQAAAWLAATAMPARQYVELLDTRLADVLADKPTTDYPTSAAATWGLALDRLRRDRPAAARLLELCAFFAPEPIATWLLGTQPMIDELVRHERDLRDPILRASLVRDIGRYSLASVDPTANAVRVHRLVQTVIRASMAEEIRAESLVRVQEILAAAATTTEGGPDRSDNWSRYESIRPHLEPTGALDSRDDEVRGLIIDMVRYLRHRNDLAGSQELAEQTLKHWASMFGADEPLTQRLRVRLAATLRDRGSLKQSYEITQDAVERLARALGPDHPYTLEALSGLGADLWWVGDFPQAREANRQAYQRWRAAVGDDHPRALNAANNLALAHRLYGDYAAAAELDERTREGHRAIGGQRNIYTLSSDENYARDLRELGDLSGARLELIHASEVAKDLLGPDGRETLRINKSLAATLRRMGEIDAAYNLVADTLERCERTLGRHHPETAACVLELACVLSARDDHAAAHVHGADALDRFTEIYGASHPLTLAAANDDAVFELRADANEDARTKLESIHDELEEQESRLGKDHPYAISAQINVATARYATGDLNGARRFDEQAHSRLVARYGADHPLALTAAANLAVSMRDTGAVQDSRTQFDEVLQRLRVARGDHHPDTRAVRAGRRLTVTIEPPPT
jgi:cellulose biosynthesis protein BcsQ/tetratricopeptide (TPR) repeat protein